VLATSYLMGWRDIPLRSKLEAALHLDAAVDNDVNLAALGESCRGAAQGNADFVFIAIGTGIGAGIMLNGQLLRGRSWMAGEVGYMIVPGTSIEPATKDSPGALESMIGGEGIRNQWKLAWRAGATSLPRDLIATDIFDHAMTGEPLAKRILDQSARVLSYAIYNISLILNCPLFVLGGSVGMHTALSTATQAILSQRSDHVAPSLVHSELGADAQLVGAIYLALSIHAKTLSTAL
jgi:glucokinase